MNWPSKHGCFLDLETPLSLPENVPKYNYYGATVNSSGEIDQPVRILNDNTRYLIRDFAFQKARKKYETQLKAKGGVLSRLDGKNAERTPSVRKKKHRKRKRKDKENEDNENGPIEEVPSQRVTRSQTKKKRKRQ